MPNAKHSGRRNAQHMRNSLGFYPCEKVDAEFFDDLNLRAVQWLSEQKVNGRNAREKFAEIGLFAESEADWIKSRGHSDNINACYTLAFATVLAAMGSFEAYNKSKNLTKK
jgi:hypothetical protein